MMQTIRPFGQIQGSDTVNAAVTGTSAATAISAPNIGVRSLRIANIGTQTIFLKFGVAATTADATKDMPMLANTVEIFLLPNDITHVAAIASTTGSTIYLTTGEGT